ncbi:MAG TPA: VOC family protein [Alphaproteobacteria bacterium]|nr:VOC family protein [Alphaproteobacteria bacterium]
MHAIDHLIWACPDLAAGSAILEGLIGTTPAAGGSHPGGGTRNALIGLGKRCYLEIIAPDPAQDPAGTPAEWMGRLARPGLVSWALAACDLGALAARLAVLSIHTKGVVAMSRRNPDGTLLRWEVLRLAGHAFGPVVPFFIDWLETPHPAAALPAAGALRRLEIRHPQAEALRRLFVALSLDVPVASGTLPALAAVLETPRGKVPLAAAEPMPPRWRD